MVVQKLQIDCKPTDKINVAQKVLSEKELENTAKKEKKNEKKEGEFSR